jgi:hypothetical protein
MKLWNKDMGCICKDAFCGVKDCKGIVKGCFRPWNEYKSEIGSLGTIKTITFVH